MRLIQKYEPEFFTKFVRSLSNEEKIWDNFRDGEQLRKHMLENEQNWQCAYTELRITEKGNSSHIDHFKRKDSLLFPQLTFDYNNLFAADYSSEEFGAKRKDKTVKKKEDYSKLLSPIDNDVQNAFIYNVTNGEIEGMSEKAKYTIDVFNLNHKDLKQKRYSIIKMIYRNEYLNNNPIEKAICDIGKFESLIRYIYTVNNN